MTKKKYKIVVFSDLKKSASNTLKSTVSLAKMINGEIEFFYVKNPSDIVERGDNQLSAMRTINEQYYKTERKILDIINPIAKAYGVKIKHSFSFGNVKDEIGQYIMGQQPDIIVLGKRKSKRISVLGDSITEFVLKKHLGAIMLAANENALEPNKGLALGVLNDTEEPLNLGIAEDLVGSSEHHLKSFKISKNPNSLIESKRKGTEKTIEYVFEQGDSAIGNISNYLLKSNINLLVINRENTHKNKLKTKTDIKEVIHKTSISLLFTGKGDPILLQN